MSRTPPIPRQLTLACCEPPGSRVPDWETLDETVRTRLLAALAKLIAHSTAANGDGRDHE